MMKNVIILLLLCLIMSPVYAVKIKIKSAYKINVAQEAVVKLNKKAMAQQNVFVIPRGRRIYSRLNDSISNVNFEQNQDSTITTQLMQDWSYKDKIAAPEGSLVKGTIKTSQNAIQITFDTIIRPDNAEIKIITKPIIMTSVSENSFIPFGTEFTIQIINDVIATPY